ncbi:hypothetical protein V6N13_071733 [Hibiscus sabdariffa]
METTLTCPKILLLVVDLAKPMRPWLIDHLCSPLLICFSMNFKMFMWNAQGCGNRNFVCVTRQYLREHSPDIIDFVETKISNSNAERVIVALNFPSSFRVEAVEFSGIIWLCWYDHVIVGDFNATVALEEHMGCSTVPGRDFITMIFNFDLYDLGYHGPDFTWTRANRVVRLDRCLCNEYWLESFPDTIVNHLLCMKSDHRPLLLMRLYPSSNDHNVNGTFPISGHFLNLSPEDSITSIAFRILRKSRIPYLPWPLSNPRTLMIFTPISSNTTGRLLVLLSTI